MVKPIRRRDKNAHWDIYVLARNERICWVKRAIGRRHLPSICILQDGDLYLSNLGNSSERAQSIYLRHSNDKVYAKKKYN